MSKVKDKKRILKAAREKQLVTYKGTHLRLSVFSTENLKKKLQAKGMWHNILKMLKEKKLPTNNTLPDKFGDKLFQKSKS